MINYIFINIKNVHVPNHYAKFPTISAMLQIIFFSVPTLISDPVISQVLYHYIFKWWQITDNEV